MNLILELDFQTHEFLSHKILRVTIEDAGIGIPNEARQKLFQPFTQAQRMTGAISGESCAFSALRFTFLVLICVVLTSHILVTTPSYQCICCPEYLLDHTAIHLFFSLPSFALGGTGLGLYSLSKRMEALGGGYGVHDRKDGENGAGAGVLYIKSSILLRVFLHVSTA